MSCFEWLCGPCVVSMGHTGADVSAVTVVPTPGGALVVADDVGVGAGVPCLSKCTIVEAKIVQCGGFEVCGEGDIQERCRE